MVSGVCTEFESILYSIFPSVDSSKPDKQDKKLDLPTPEGPTIATRDPEGIDKSRFRKSHFLLRTKPRF